MELPQLPQDKANHTLYGAAIYILFGSAAVLAGHADVAMLAGLVAAGTAAVAKEISDYVLDRRAVAAGQPPSHDVEFADALATFGGGLVCWAAALVTGS